MSEPLQKSRSGGMLLKQGPFARGGHSYPLGKKLTKISYLWYDPANRRQVQKRPIKPEETILL